MTLSWRGCLTYGALILLMGAAIALAYYDLHIPGD